MKRFIGKTAKKSGTITSIFAATFLLGACSSDLYGVSAVSVMATDKTITDHIISFASNKDCSVVRSELGKTYCKEDDPSLLIKDPKMHCYRELGRVTCYEDPDFISPRASIEDKKPAFER